MIFLNEENIFEIAEAIHCYASLNYSGQNSELYKILSQSQFNPGPLWSETRCLIENEYVSLLNDETCINLSKQLSTLTKELL